MFVAHHHVAVDHRRSHREIRPTVAGQFRKIIQKPSFELREDQQMKAVTTSAEKNLEGSPTAFELMWNSQNGLISRNKAHRRGRRSASLER